MTGKPVVVVAGVSGAGKTSLGRALALSLAVPFIDADDLHPEANRAKMGAGVPLTDEDRAPWLDALAEAIVAARESGLVLACSALKRAYRDRLRQARPDLALVLLSGSREVLAERMTARRGHYMPASLLDSQIKTLEPPGPDEAAIEVSIALSPAEQLKAVLRALEERSLAPGS